ncbi:hypothetical protein [Streptomyces orinoci]|uniref:DUF7848 domain-containing protein n=1 Tax=Streptomyces orinoci TaxID=67339 RepID=A0ABV3K5A2_STRON|nr:hypothetical protein [Streptomyces orinoci]
MIQHAQWRIGPAKAPGNPPLAHEMVCVACTDSSGPRREFEAACDWAFRHSGGHLSHTAYREVVHRYWRTAPVD